MTHKARIALAAALLPFLAACGGTFTSGLPKDKRIADLTETERSQYCESLAMWKLNYGSQDEQELSCLVVGATQAILVGSSDPNANAEAICQEAYSSCMGQPFAGGMMPNIDCLAGMGQCQATVSEMERCHQALNDAQQDQAKDLAARMSCATVVKDSDWTDALNPQPSETPAECANLGPGCSGLGLTDF